MRRILVVGGLLAVVAAAALALALGGGDGCGDGYPSTPECVAEAFVTGTDASKCDLVDPALLEEVVGAGGPAARERCARTVSTRSAPEEIEILEREQLRDGTVVVEFFAGGEEGSLTVRNRGGRWRIVSFAE